MVREGLFSDLPPPRAARSNALEAAPPSPQKHPGDPSSQELPLVAPKPAIKRPSETVDHEEGPKKVRFKTTLDASAIQVADAMRKIASHIGKASKFSKASKLAMQLLHSGGLNKDTVDLFFDILKASMVSPSVANLPTVRQDYHELFSAVAEKIEIFSSGQQAQLEVWIIWAQVVNDFFTDDTFVFSKAASRVRQYVSSLPEAMATEDAAETTKNKETDVETHEGLAGGERFQSTPEIDEADSDPFGLNALLEKPSKREERISKRREEEAATRKVQEEEAKLLRERREALMSCLEIAAGRYRVKWAQTIIDILVKHAIDNISKFTSPQRTAIENLWSSVKEQQIRRKQGKSATGKLDVTGFERLQSQYSQAKISIRHSVGADGDRGAEQWLG
ncbi:hypothetical protein GOP47_0005459 [Adiantum capillus-veneris]|uniref:Uncharacterized protein n=1 Tax=Adiantum capillus-veneris TaxID=13818 RepID=A0A9D4V547_ADICA|nr:hypothetical protein GOP47_0005459 [Adiantum capillus-veneris]